MSTVMRPAGPLPPRVYWARRVLAVALVGILAIGGWWLAGGSSGDGGAPTAADPNDAQGGAEPTRGVQAMLEPPKGPPTGQHSPTADQTSTAGPTPDAPARGAGHGRDRNLKGSERNRPGNPKGTPLEKPTGNCDPGQVHLSIDVSDSVEGRSNTATFVMRLPRTSSACTLAVTPDTTAVRVTSGPDVVWSSADCPDALLAKELVVRSDPATVYQFQWNGRRSTDECKVPGRVAPPGGYWVEAAFVGGEPQEAYFDIVEPRSANR